MKATSGHTAACRGKRVTVVLTNGHSVTGRFHERTRNQTIVLVVNGRMVRIPRDQVGQFLAGKYVKESR